MRLKTTLFLFINLLYFSQVEAQSCNGADFEERNGIAILELDSKISGSWKKESISGATAGKAITYRGSDSFGKPGNSPIVYKVKINSPGTYRFKWRNKISIVAKKNANTEHNDSWLKIEASNFFARSGGKTIFPGGSGKTPIAKGATSGGWFKIYTNSIGWSWRSVTSDFENFPVYATFNKAGVYNVRVSGRSKGHSIDRLVLYKENQYSAAQSESLARGATSCSGGTPPTGNNAPTVNITSPNNNQKFNAGANITVRLNSNDSDGNVTKHEIFVNNSRVSNQGGNYTPFVVRNLKAGNYAIKATVTDNDGDSSSNTVNVTVGNAVPPTGNKAPTVNITSPSNNQNIKSGSNVVVRLSANDSDGNIAKHEIFVNNNKVDSDGLSYSPHIINNIKPGNYTIKAIVTDNGGKTASASVNISVDGNTTPPTGNKAPTVSITNLSSGNKVAVGSTVSVKIAANDSDGRVVKHQVFVNGKLVDTDGNKYTAHPIKNIAAGNYKIKVTVTDDKGATGSSTVDITAGSGTPPTNSAVSFNLINANTNGSIGPLVNGATISSSKTKNVNIRVNVPAGTKRVGIEVFKNGKRTQTGFELFAPYAVFGDIKGNYNNANLGNGSYRLIAAAYSSTSDRNSVLARKEIKFTVGSTSGKSAILFPNPVQTDGVVSVRLPEGSTGQFDYSVTNSLGIQVESGTFDAQSSERDVQLSLPNIGRQVQGVYYMTLSSEGSRETIPLIRE